MIPFGASNTPPDFSGVCVVGQHTRTTPGTHEDLVLQATGTRTELKLSIAWPPGQMSVLGKSFHARATSGAELVGLQPSQPGVGNHQVFVALKAVSGR